MRLSLRFLKTDGYEVFQAPGNLDIDSYEYDQYFDSPTLLLM